MVLKISDANPSAEIPDGRHNRALHEKPHNVKQADCSDIKNNGNGRREPEHDERERHGDVAHEIRCAPHGVSVGVACKRMAAHLCR